MKSQQRQPKARAFEYPSCQSYSYMYTKYIWYTSRQKSGSPPLSIIGSVRQSGTPSILIAVRVQFERWNFVRDIRMGRILICLNEILI